MGFVQAVKTCLGKYVTFSGRASRSEYWWFFLFEVVVVIVASMVSDMLSTVAAVAVFLPGVAVGARRLHDVGRSGWFLLLWFIPLVNLILLYWAVLPSDDANEWGTGPDLISSGAVPPGVA